ncbi:response regulator [Deinococcus sp. HMF7604]|uniref:response regulator n=1 Tax=Deinococcus betulae TaxID=2873312 RepID=UPI001CCB100E|nr:response regulator [Deinococcus betulae]MBZ9751417.1 response regulator [Deinococcus betulae]
MTRPPVHLLLVEDNPADVFLLEAALDLAAVPVEMTVARDGLEALEYLHQTKAGARLPDLILLDLNMPRMNGFEFLAAARADPDLMGLVILVFTTSNAEADVKRAYALQANAYLSKPANLDAFLQTVHLLEAHWFGAATLPRSFAP